VKTLFAAAAVTLMIASSAAAMPAPSSWALMLAGLTSLGAMFRTTRQRSIPVAA
jgi:hypothetical protein